MKIKVSKSIVCYYSPCDLPSLEPVVSHISLTLSAEVGGVGVARQTRDASVLPAAVVTIQVIITRNTVTVWALIVTCTLNSEPLSQSYSVP